MIGGQDVVLKARGDCASLEACARFVARSWPAARFEDAVTGSKFKYFGDVPYGEVRELLAYENEDAERMWDLDRSDAPENSMIYLIVQPREITVVVDNPEALEMKSILNAMREWLWMRNGAPSAKHRQWRGVAA